MVFHEVKLLNDAEVISVSIPTPKDVKSAAMIKRLGLKTDAPVVLEYTTMEIRKRNGIGACSFLLSR